MEANGKRHIIFFQDHFRLSNWPQLSSQKDHLAKWGLLKVKNIAMLLGISVKTKLSETTQIMFNTNYFSTNCYTTLFFFKF